MPNRKYVAYWRTKDLGNGAYTHVAVLNALGRAKFGRATYTDIIRYKGSKRTKRLRA